MRDTPGEKGVGERGYGGSGKGNTTVKDTLNCAVINVTRKKRWLVMYMKKTLFIVFVTESWVNKNTMDSE